MSTTPAPRPHRGLASVNNEAVRHHTLRLLRDQVTVSFFIAFLAVAMMAVEVDHIVRNG